MGGNQIAFWHPTNGPPASIWVMSATGGGVTQITSAPGNDVSPSWSPDGSLIAFSRNADIWVIDAPPPVAIDDDSWSSIKGKYR